MAEKAHSTPARAAQPARNPGIHTLLPYGCPKGVSPAAWRQALEDRIEAHRAAMDALISALDTMDGDPDFEPDSDSEPQGDDEPSLGWVALPGGAVETGGDLYCLGPDLEADWSDYEPSLGWVTRDDGRTVLGGVADCEK